MMAISGVIAGQVVVDNSTIAPFLHVVVTDANSAGVETVTVAISPASDGTLSNLGNGAYNAATGVYMVTGTAAAVTTALEGLVFTPAPNQTAPTVTTSFTIVDTSASGSAASDNATTVVSVPTQLSGPLSAATALIGFSAHILSVGTQIQDSASNVSANLDGLQTIAAARDLGAITLTDGGTPYIALTAAQLTRDAFVLHDLASPCAFRIGAAAPNVTIAGVNPQDIAVFTGKAGQYSIAGNGLGATFTVTDTGTGRTSADHLSDIEFVQFADRMMFVATKAEAQIALLYQGALGRTPDVIGLVGWQNSFATESLSARQADTFTALAGTSVAGLPNLAYGFTQSAEFQQKYGSLTNAQFVTQLYANVLDRAPDTAGLSAWVNALAQHHTREWVLTGLVESAEAYHDAQLGYVGQSGAHAPWLVIL